MGKQNRLLLIYNPHAHSGKSITDLPDILEYFKDHDVSVDVVETNGPDDATKKAAAACATYATIVAAGGDGTINEVINGIVSGKNKKKNKNKKQPRLGIIPMGTENVLAQELGISLDPYKACERIIKGTAHAVDLGVARTSTKKRYFIIASGIGFDAHIANSIDPALKKLIGSTAYVLTGLRELFNYTPSNMRIKINGVECRGYFVIVGNAKLYGGGTMLTHKADMTDGLLDACILQSRDVFNFIKFLFGVAIQKHDYFENVVYAHTKKLSIESDKPVLVHVDCEILGTTPVEIQVCPKKLEIIH
ncbi:MAG: diacylglycerol kinase family lipid kinase [Candidatus Woesearchaeota archaeon]|nr:diacylglycerol kinase family lipid kinase [Candidatus Woesearchaeota archaeon]